MTHGDWCVQTIRPTDDQERGSMFLHNDRCLTPSEPVLPRCDFACSACREKAEAPETSVVLPGSPTPSSEWDAIEETCPDCGGDRWVVAAEPGRHGEPAEPYQAQCPNVMHAAIADLRADAALRAASSPALDVERLAEAMNEAYYPGDDDKGLRDFIDDTEWWEKFALLVAAEYALLAATPTQRELDVMRQMRHEESYKEVAGELLAALTDRPAEKGAK